MPEKNELHPNKKIAPNRGLFLAAAFLLIIFGLPAATLCRNLISDKKPVSMEQKEEPAPQQGWFLTMQAKIKDFTDGLVLRPNLISLNTELSSAVSGRTYIQSTQVLCGKNGWLFYKNPNDGNPLWDYLGTHPYTPEQLADAASHLSAFQHFLASSDIRFLAVIYPNKEQIYPEYMPDTVLKINDISRADLLADYIRANTDVPLLFPREDLLSAKKQYELYYRSDTHWNTIGAFVGLQSVFRELYGAGASPDTVSFSVDRADYTGDLALICDLGRRYHSDAVYSFDMGSIDPSQYHDEVLLLIGDSFTDLLSYVVRPYYREVYTVRTADFTLDMIGQYRPDLVIWECVERRVDTFFTEDLMTR